MVSEKQLEANRRNAQRSTGPRTPEGKDRVRGNAITHGLRAETFEVLPDEDEGQFAAKLEAWNRDMRPASEAESELVRRAAILSWKLDRADRYEAAVLSKRMMEAVNACDCEDDDAPTLREEAAVASFDPSNEGERLRRYQSSLHRSLLRTVDTLLKLRRDEAKATERAIRANEAIAPVIAPNKPISTSTGAPNKPISSRVEKPSSRVGARELDQFVAEDPSRDLLGSSLFDFSPRMR